MARLAANLVGLLPMLDTAAIIAALENAPGVLIPMVREIPEHLRRNRPAPEKWSAHEQMCHLADVNPLFSRRLDIILGESDPQIVPYFPDPAEAKRWLQQDLEETMERFSRERERLCERLCSLTPAQWEKPVRHAEYARYSAYI